MICLKQRNVISVCIIWVTVGVLCCGFWGSTKKDIDVKGISSVAVVPFLYTQFRHFSEKSGDIVAENITDIIEDRCEWKCIDVETVKKTMKKLNLSEKKILSTSQAAELGKELGVDMVIVGNLPTYDEQENARYIPEAGGGFTENIRELDVEYDMFFIKVSDGSLIKNVKKEQSVRDTAKDPMMPDPPEKQLKHATRRMAKKLVKRFMTE